MCNIMHLSVQLAVHPIYQISKCNQMRSIERTPSIPCCACIALYLHVNVNLDVYASLSPSMSLSISPSFYLPGFPSISCPYLSICPSISVGCLPACLSVCLRLSHLSYIISYCPILPSLTHSCLSYLTISYLVLSSCPNQSI